MATQAIGAAASTAAPSNTDLNTNTQSQQDTNVDNVAKNTVAATEESNKSFCASLNCCGSWAKIALVALAILAVSSGVGAAAFLYFGLAAELSGAITAATMATLGLGTAGAYYCSKDKEVAAANEAPADEVIDESNTTEKVAPDVALAETITEDAKPAAEKSAPGYC